ncbi:MAG: hypothetical protein LBN99_04955 [Oscillospiraceae bacterium]|jgi:hypothetical protein|nr:hypothetical protein [Oscillospiraceae bacterium]
MKKQRSVIVTIICTLAALAAIAVVIIVFREELCCFFTGLRDKLRAVKDEVLTPEEYSDYADVE